jgi:hypothetical protein
MLTAAALIKMAFALGLSIHFEPVTELDMVVRYYSEETDTIVDCIPVTLDVGKASVCPYGEKDAVVYVVTQ